MRLKHRYLIVRLVSDASNALDDAANTTSTVTSKEILQAVRDSIQSLYGDIGAGLMGMSTVVKYYDPLLTRNVVVLRVGREYLNQVWTAMSCVSLVRKKNVSLVVLRVASCNRTCADKLADLMSVHFAAEGEDPATLNELKQRIREAFDQI